MVVGKEMERLYKDWHGSDGACFMLLHFDIVL